MSALSKVRALDWRENSRKAEIMCVLRTIVLVLAAVFAAAPVVSSDNLEYLFAGCVGRFSAEIEHAWLMNDRAADRLADRRRTFISLMEATMPRDAAPGLLRHRIDNKVAHASLLSVATFGRNDKQAKAAKTAARALILRCERLLLDS